MPFSISFKRMPSSYVSFIGHVQNKVNEGDSQIRRVVENVKEVFQRFVSKQVIMRSYDDVKKYDNLLESREKLKNGLTKIESLKKEIKEAGNSIRVLEKNSKKIEDLQTQIQTLYRSKSGLEVQFRRKNLKESGYEAIKKSIQEDIDDKEEELNIIKSEILSYVPNFKDPQKVNWSKKELKKSLQSFLGEKIKESRKLESKLNKEIDEEIFNVETVQRKIDELNVRMSRVTDITSEYNTVLNELDETVKKLTVLVESEFKIEKAEDVEMLAKNLNKIDTDVRAPRVVSSQAVERSSSVNPEESPILNSERTIEKITFWEKIKSALKNIWKMIAEKFSALNKVDKTSKAKYEDLSPRTELDNERDFLIPRANPVQIR